MKQTVIFGLLIIGLTIDSILFEKIYLFGIRPSVLLALVIALGVANGRFTGSMSGLVAGLMMDSLFGVFLGYYTLPMMFSGYIASSLCRRVFSNNLVVISTVTAATFFVREIVHLVFALIVGVKTESVVLIFLRYIIPSALLTAVCALPVNIFIRYLFGKQFMKKKWRISLE